MKVDISRFGETVLSIPAVTTWRSAGRTDLLAELQPRQIVFAYDAEDAFSNWRVAKAAAKMAHDLRPKGYRVTMAA